MEARKPSGDGVPTRPGPKGTLSQSAPLGVEGQAYWTPLALVQDGEQQTWPLTDAPSTRGHSHIIDLDVAVIRSSNKELGIRGKSQGADGHGVA